MRASEVDRIDARYLKRENAAIPAYRAFPMRPANRYRWWNNQKITRSVWKLLMEVAGFDTELVNYKTFIIEEDVKSNITDSSRQNVNIKCQTIGNY